MRNALAFGVAALLAAPVLVRAQDAAAQLARAVLIERQEGDLGAAEQEYRKLAGDSGDTAVRTEAALHLGELLWRLDKKDDARPFLERVRGAGGELGARAEAVLQGQDPAGKQAQELAEQAQRLVGTFVENGGNPPVAELRWLGAAAVQAVAARLSALRANAIEQAAKLDREPSSDRRSAALFAIRAASLLWSIGGADAKAWLQQAAVDPEVVWRRLVAFGAATNDGPQVVDETLMPVAEAMVGDADPAGIVPQAILRRVSHRLSIERVAQCLDDPRPTLRSEAWNSLYQQPCWQQRGAIAARAMALVLPAVQRALTGSDPATARSAFSFLARCGSTTEDGARVLLEWLPKVPAVETMPGTLLAGVADIATCAKALGPANAADGKDPRRAFLANMVTKAPGDSAAPLLDMIELGYDELPNIHADLGVRAAKSRSTPADLERLARLLDRCSSPGAVVEVLVAMELPGGAFAPLRAELARKYASAPPVPRDWNQMPSGLRWAATEISLYLTAIGQTGNADAIPFLRELLQQRTDYIDSVAQTARTLQRRTPTAAGAALLRDLLVAKELTPNQRNLTFAQLAAAGDVDAIPLFARAYELGLEAGQRDDDTAVSARDVGKRRGVQWLEDYLAPPDRSGSRPSTPLHGYDQEHLLAAWRALLQSPARDAVLADVRGDPGALDPAVRGLLVDTVAARTEQPDVDARRLQDVVKMLTIDTPVDDSPASTAYRAAIARLLRQPELAGSVLEGGVPAKPFADELRQLLPGPNGPDALRALIRGGVELSAEEMLGGLRATRHRYNYLGALPDTAPPEVVRAVEAFATDDDQSLRLLACERLGRMLSLESVPVLLTALRDTNDRVREAATAALQQIRLYHEQKAFWDERQSGVSTSKQAATAKLLAQSKPDQPKDQRLLALQSLGLLGAPEALPYLIDWAKDGDADVAAAARAAIGKIQAAAK